MYENVNNRHQLESLIREMVQEQVHPDVEELEYHWFGETVQGVLANQHDSKCKTIGSAFTWSGVPPSPQFWQKWDTRCMKYAVAKMEFKMPSNVVYNREDLIYRFYPVNSKGVRVAMCNRVDLLSVACESMVNLFESTITPVNMAKIKTEEKTGLDYWEIDFSGMETIRGLTCSKCDALVNNEIELRAHICNGRLKKYEY